MSSVNAYPGLERICVTCVHRPAVDSAVELAQQQDAGEQPEAREVHTVDDLLVPTFLGTTAAAARAGLEGLSTYAETRPCNFVKNGGRCMVAGFAVNRLFNVVQGK